MTIKISNNAITFGNFVLTSNTQGFTFDGKIRTKRGFVDSRPQQDVGTVQGFIAGGQDSSPTKVTIIEKFPFSSDVDSVDTGGDLDSARDLALGNNSETSGYCTGGISLDPAPTPSYTNTIQKYPFAISSGTATDIGDLTTTTATGASMSSRTHGYRAGGDGGGSPVGNNVIDRYPFAVDTNATDVGDVLGGIYFLGGGGCSSKENGYIMGGYGSPFPTFTDTIQKFPFAVPTTNASDVGDLGSGKAFGSSQNSTTHAYTSGSTNPSFTNTIQKTPFAIDTNATDVGDLTQARGSGCGHSSITHGYVSGGQTDPSTRVNTIDKFPFAVDANATDVGNMTSARNRINGGSND